MPSQPPLILADNVFDRINLYPSAVLSSSGAAPGTDVRYVADYRRERTQWKAATNAVDRYVRVDLGFGNTRAVDFVWIDRGHTLWGNNVLVEGSDDNFVATPNSVGAVVPASGTVGGDPEAGWCVTEEGALYRLFAAFAARRYLQVRDATAAQPILTGAILGARTQLLSYSDERDEDGGDRVERSHQSDAGYTATERVYAGRSFNVSLDLIGAAEYDAQLRTLRTLFFEKNQRAVVVANYGTHPARAWLYRLNSRRWSAPMKSAHRKCSIPLVEEGPVIR